MNRYVLTTHARKRKEAFFANIKLKEELKSVVRCSNEEVYRLKNTFSYSRIKKSHKPFFTYFKTKSGMYLVCENKTQNNGTMKHIVVTIIDLNSENDSFKSNEFKKEAKEASFKLCEFEKNQAIEKEKEINNHPDRQSFQFLVDKLNQSGLFKKNFTFKSFLKTEVKQAESRMIIVLEVIEKMKEITSKIESNKSVFFMGKSKKEYKNELSKLIELNVLMSTDMNLACLSKSGKKIVFDEFIPYVNGMSQIASKNNKKCLFDAQKETFERLNKDEGFSSSFDIVMLNFADSLIECSETIKEQKNKIVLFALNKRDKIYLSEIKFQITLMKFFKEKVGDKHDQRLLSFLNAEERMNKLGVVDSCYKKLFG